MGQRQLLEEWRDETASFSSSADMKTKPENQ